MAAPQITTMFAFTSIISADVAGINAVANKDGSVDVSGTVVGVSQATQSLVSLGTTGAEGVFAEKLVPGAGIVLGGAGIYVSAQNIADDSAHGKSAQLSDIASIVGNVASIAGSALIIAGVGGTLIVPLTVVAIGAGVFQLVAGSSGWTVDSAGNAVKTLLNPQQQMQANVSVQAMNSNQSALAGYLQSANVTAPGTSVGNVFLVPTLDSDGNLSGYSAEVPTSAQIVDPATTIYTFADGTTLKDFHNYVNDDGTPGITISPFDNRWQIPTATGGVASLNTNSTTGAYDYSVTDSSGQPGVHFGMTQTVTVQDGVTTKTQNVFATNGGVQTSAAGTTIVTKSDTTSGATLSVETITPKYDDFGNPVANNFVITIADGSNTIIDTGTRIVDPADGSFTDTLFGSATTADPSGTIGQTTTDANGNVTTNLSTISINQLGVAAQDFNDAAALLQAIQNHQPVPTLSSGLQLANDLSGQQVPELSGAADAAGILASLQGFASAIKTGNVDQGIISGSNLFAQSVNSYVAVAYGDSINAAADGLGGLVTAASDVADVVPYLGLADDLIHGDYTAAAGAAVGIAVTAALEGAEYGSAAGPIGAAVGFVAGLVFGEMFGPTPPTPWGSANAYWDPSSQSIKVNSTGHAGGDQIVSSTLTSLVGDLQSLTTTFNAQVPASEQIGIISQRLGSLNYAPAAAPDGSEPEAYSVTTIDPTTGAQLNGSLHFDATSGQALDAGVNDPAYFETLGQYYINNALARQAIAPLWEVQTAQLQQQNGLSNASLSEVERDANQGLLASSVPAGAATEDWNPIGLDLGGGLAATSLANSGVQFDVDGTTSLDAELSGQADRKSVV